MVRPSAAAGPPSSHGPDALDAIALLADHGVTTFEVTAIDRDGLLQGPDLDLFSRAVELGRVRIIASAGITSKKDVAAVRAIGCAGAIIGPGAVRGPALAAGRVVRRGIGLTSDRSSCDPPALSFPAKFPRVER